MLVSARKFRIALLAAFDLALAYAALAAALYLRYRAAGFSESWERHTQPFTIVFGLWLVVFYIVGLYDLDRVRNRLDLLSRGGEALAASFLLSLGVFYLIPDFRIEPRTNLAIAMTVFAALFLSARLLLMHVFALRRFRLKLLFFGAAPEAEDLCQTLAEHPHLGYDCLGVTDERSADDRLTKADVIVVSHFVPARPEIVSALYRRFFEAATILDFPSFYESIRRAVPASAMNEVWILDNVARRDPSIYEQFKRPIEALAATVLLAPAAPLIGLAALAIRFESPGPVFFSQTRVGLRGKPFRIRKLRTMRVGAEASGAVFAAEDDPRVTRVGRFLRKTRLDELPQLWNILKGEMSFVGPRPERPEFEAEIAKRLPLFPVRHLVRPGLTGWAQVNAPYASTAEDHEKKLRHDLYYLKHRSLTLDAAIILKTAYSVLKRQGR